MKIKHLALLLAIFTLLTALVSCGAPAPSGMYAPEDSDIYIEGVENAIFSVPDNYTVTMSSNMLAAKGEKDSFSLQCRHSDYYYGDLHKNYVELKAELSGLYGDFDDTLYTDRKAAGQDAYELQYSLTISGEKFDYTQFFFYEGRNHFYLFTYTAPAGEGDRELLLNVLDTLSLDKENYKTPEGYRKVENAEADKITFDRYELYCPDEWILDTTTGQICMRVPSSKIVSTVTFNELKTGVDLEAYAREYREKVAPALGETTAKGLREYILASVYMMTERFDNFTLLVSGSEGVSPMELTKDKLKDYMDDYMQTYTSSEGLTYTYVEFKADLSDYSSHGSGGLFVDTRDLDEDEEIKPSTVTYRVRQYFVTRGEYLYFFTYLSTDKYFESQESDAVKVVKNFVLK